MLKSKKTTIGLIALVSFLLISAIVGTTFAYYQETAQATENTFTVAGSGNLLITETFTAGDLEKKNVYVTLNGGDGSVYVRATLAISFQDKDGNILAKIPVKDTDYTIEMGANWMKHTDGYWYYNSTVAPDTSTTNLIVSCKTLSTEYKLVVDVLAQSVQASPSSAVVDLWGFDPLADSGS